MTDSVTCRNKFLLKQFLLISFSCFIFSASFSQYYLRGEVKDENNNSLANAKILLHSTNYLYYPVTSVVFEILINNPFDTVTISADGFKPLSAALEAGQYQYIVLNLLFTKSGNTKHCASLTKNFQPSIPKANPDGSKYLSLFMENSFVEASRFPETNFGINPDKISYNNLQRYIDLDGTVPPDALRVEELLNYFNLDYKEPLPDSNFSFSSYLTQCPWNEKNQLLFLHANAKKNDFR